MKLGPDGSHNPEVGLWYRVCQGCYGSREDRDDAMGVYRSWTDQFVKKRQPNVEWILIEANKLERRMQKVNSLLNNKRLTVQFLEFHQETRTAVEVQGTPS